MTRQEWSYTINYSPDSPEWESPQSSTVRVYRQKRVPELESHSAEVCGNDGKPISLYSTGR